LIALDSGGKLPNEVSVASAPAARWRKDAGDARLVLGRDGSAWLAISKFATFPLHSSLQMSSNCASYSDRIAVKIAPLFSGPGRFAQVAPLPGAVSDPASMLPMPNKPGRGCDGALSAQ
jgi:hypothetical protein